MTLLLISDDNVVFSKLSELQVAVYEMILEHPGIKFVLSADEPCSCGGTEKQKNCHNVSNICCNYYKSNIKLVESCRYLHWNELNEI